MATLATSGVKFLSGVKPDPSANVVSKKRFAPLCFLPSAEQIKMDGWMDGWMDMIITSLGPMAPPVPYIVGFHF